MIIILVIMTGFSLTLKAQSWTYWKTGTVNQLTDAGTGYQIKLIVHYGAGADSGEDVFLNGNSRNDFADLRFFEGSTELPYWMESMSPGSAAIFWVKLNGDLSSHNIDLTIKYGNPSATSTSNAENTFIFFDDFSKDLSKWTKHKELDTSTITIPAGQDYVHLGGGNTTTPTYGHTVLGSAPVCTSFKNNAVEYRYSVSANGISEVGFRGTFGNPGTGMKGRSDARTIPGGTGGQSFLSPPYWYMWNFLTDAGQDQDRPVVSTWYRGTITAYNTSLKLYRDDVLKRSSNLGDPNQIGEISLQNHYGEFSDYDWVAVRKFANAEPNLGPWGDETLPVELSSFNAVLAGQNNVVLTWVTQSENAVMGFYVFRGTDTDLVNTQQVSPLIDATNTSEQKTYVYTDQGLNQMGTYYYWLMIADMDGSESFHGPIYVTYEAAQPDTPNIPLLTELKQVYPNPFNPDTNISYVLAKPSEVSIAIYNIRGQEVRRFELGTKAAGSWKIAWDGKDQNGTGLSSGVYYIRMQAGQDSFTKKAVLMK